MSPDLYALALESRLIAEALSTPNNPVTDHGSCALELGLFAAFVAEECARIAGESQNGSVAKAILAAFPRVASTKGAE